VQFDLKDPVFEIEQIPNAATNAAIAQKPKMETAPRDRFYVFDIIYVFLIATARYPQS
jgi:hypothetical protein